MTNTRVYRTPFVVGLPVFGKQFFGRQEQVRQFYGQCIMGPVLQPTRILGLKRSGKTSFLNYILDSNTREQFLDKSVLSETKFVYVNAQSFRSCDEFFNTVAGSISEQIASPTNNIPEIKTGRAFKRWLEHTLRAFLGIKVIVLIDEFEKLYETENFDVEFFGLLRAIASAHPSSFTWVTASAIDLYTLDKSQKTSPFWNIFHQTPIIMGGFDGQDAQLLIKDSMKSIGEAFTKREVDEIIVLAGNIPYFIQSVADSWYRVRGKQKLHSIIRDDVFGELSKPSNQIQHVYQGYWDEMSEKRRTILKNIASERRDIEGSFSDLCTLTDFGLIVPDNTKHGKYKISGQLLKQFIIDAENGIESRSMELSKETQQKAETKLVIVEKDTHINTGGGNYIQGDTNTGGGNIMRDNYGSSGMTATDIAIVFQNLYSAINNNNDLTESEKTDLTAEVGEIKKELYDKERPDESFLLRKFRNIGRMAPDILDVTLAIMTNPTAGLGVVAKKIANKMKESAK